MSWNLPWPEPLFSLGGFRAIVGGTAWPAIGQLAQTRPDVGARAAAPTGHSPWSTQTSRQKWRRGRQIVEQDDHLTLRAVEVLSIRVRSLIRFATVLVLVLSLGLHWALLQSVAWVGMVASYSRNASFTEAVSNTFDGKHPCPLCKMIQKARADERQQDQKQKIKPFSKMEMGLLCQNTLGLPKAPYELIFCCDMSARLRTLQPPKPPPRRS
ncbi:MAG TPA: hypothetical protein VL171_15800 [Verrucomicrobiae bacterium]|nr:hypothetical protein [Verrucomicrobiae bacterium]